MNTIITSVTKEQQKARLGFGKFVKGYFADEPNGPIIVTLDIPGAWEKYLCIEVGVLLWSVKFCVLAVK